MKLNRKSDSDNAFRRDCEKKKERTKTSERERVKLSSQEIIRQKLLTCVCHSIVR